MSWLQNRQSAPSMVRMASRHFGKKIQRALLPGRMVAFATQIAFPEVESDLVQSALLPLLGLRQPKCSSLGIKRGALPT
jgi:hypothetical protein